MNISITWDMFDDCPVVHFTEQQKLNFPQSYGELIQKVDALFVDANREHSLENFWSAMAGDREFFSQKSTFYCHVWCKALEWVR